MPQNRQSGAAANVYGRETAPKIAAALGAEMSGSQSNKATLDGKQVVIKCAGKGTKSVGVTFTMLESLDSVLAAFQHKTGAYEVYALPASVFGAHARESPSEPHVGLVTRKVFEEKGKRVKVVKGI